MQPLLDISDINSITQTAYVRGSPVYSLKAPNDKYILLGQISIGADSSFIANGKIFISINDQAVTSKSSSLTEIGIISFLTVDFKEKDFIFIQPQGQLIIDGRVSSGTGLLQIEVSGTILTPEEFKLLEKKYLGIN